MAATEPPYTARLHFSYDAGTGLYRLTIHYQSSARSARHEQIHAELKNKAIEWLFGQGIDESQGLIEIERVECETVPEAVEAVPLIEVTTVEVTRQEQEQDASGSR